MYDDITTHVPEYYLFGAEEEILRKKSDEIVAAMHQVSGGLFTNEVVLEVSIIVVNFLVVYSCTHLQLGAG
jgi:hypothetical protein